jgi:hypothetical protein
MLALLAGGTQLQAALTPQSAFPSGYQYFGSTFSNSGDRLETGPVKYKPSSISCAAFAVFSGQAGWGETAFAGTAYARPLGSMLSAEHGTEYLESVDQFAGPAGASSYWHGLRQLTARCPGLGSASPSVPVTADLARPAPRRAGLPAGHHHHRQVLRAHRHHADEGVDRGRGPGRLLHRRGRDQPASPGRPHDQSLTRELIARVQNAHPPAT